LLAPRETLTSPISESISLPDESGKKQSADAIIAVVVAAIILALIVWFSGIVN
jgi:hypothetical protein